MKYAIMLLSSEYLQWYVLDEYDDTEKLNAAVVNAIAAHGYEKVRVAMFLPITIQVNTGDPEAARP